MKRLAFLLLLLAAGTAEAQTAAPAPQAVVPSSPAAPSSAEAQPPGLEVMYACPGGTDFAAVFSKDGDLATLTVPGQPQLERARQQAASGFADSDSYSELRGRGREATLTAAGRSMRCHAIGRPGEPPHTYEGGGLTITLFPDGIFRLRERRDGGEPVPDLGQWFHEVDGGLRLVLRGGTVARRAFREATGDRLIAENGTELVRAPKPDLIEGPFQLAGLYRDTPTGGLFAECLTGRTYPVSPSGAEPDLEHAWTEATPVGYLPVAALEEPARGTPAAKPTGDSGNKALDLLPKFDYAGGEVGFFYGKSNGKYSREVVAGYLFGEVVEGNTHITVGTSYEHASGRVPVVIAP